MGVHRFAIATALATFALLFFGGLVSATDSGLACPDWPLCEGQFIPRMVDGKEFEHTHRLVASFVGAMAFGLGALLWKHRRGDRPLVRLGLWGCVLVTVQALLGALTVVLKLPWYVSSAHLATAMLFLSVAVTLAFWTHPGFEGPSTLPVAERRAIFWVTALVFVQIVSGAVMRHLRGGLACGFDLPLCLGSWWPLDGHLGVQVHMVHRALAVASGLSVLALGAWLLARGGVPRRVRLLALGAAVVVLAQVLLGLWTVLASRDLVVMTAHTTVAPLLLALCVALYWSARGRQRSLTPEPADGVPVGRLEPA